MLDFVKISTRSIKKDTVEIYPKFVVRKSKDLMVRGGDFYAVWVEERGLWSTDEQDVLDLIDRELEKETEKFKEKSNAMVVTSYLWDAGSGSIDRWHKYVQRQMRDDFIMLDEKLMFSNTVIKKEDYASKRLGYPLENGDISAYDKLISTIYSPEERHKIEWAIGAVVSGESVNLQKFLVLYGAAGTGKSTILNIIQMLFEGYYSVFDAKALGSSNDSFALEAFKSNPLVAIQHDGDLSRIEDNTRLNSLVSHELMTVNEKFKATYSSRFKSFLFMGTNKPVKITDARSGILRRLIDVTPSGQKVGIDEYNRLMNQIKFELGAIAYHCKEVYLDNPKYYDKYTPKNMFGATNDFYNFVEDSYHVFKKEDGTTLKIAWEMYKTYCESAKVPFPYSRRTFKEELKAYFWEYEEKLDTSGMSVVGYYKRFRTDKFENTVVDISKEKNEVPKWLEFGEYESIFDKVCADCYAQYANDEERPIGYWDKTVTKLSSLDTSILHYVRVPENHIVIDFDIKDSEGNKSFELNLKEANKFPPTYAELSKSGGGIHLHYIYQGDVTKLSRVYDENIEIKVFTGKSALRRKLSKCNNLDISTIGSGLPLKGDDKVVSSTTINDEKHLRVMIKKNLCKEFHSSTKCSVDFIYDLVEKYYNSGKKYDISDLRPAIISFAAGSTHNSDKCLKLIGKMHYKSDEPSVPVDSDNSTLVFYDVEVFPNLFLVNWKQQGEGKQVVRMINPTPQEIEELCKFRLVGFNNRRYDNHMLYARMMGYSNKALFDLSQKIIVTKKGESNKCLFGEAYNLSYTDVYDFASAGNKKSLKKLEIEMGNISEKELAKKGFSESEIKLIKAGSYHQELGLPWDKPVPEELWHKVAEYCDNDVIATEAAFTYLKGDWLARQILADTAGMTVNDTTNSLSTRIIFGNNKHPQDEFNYRDLSKPVGSDQYEEYRRKFGPDYNFRVFDENGLPQYRDYVPGEVLPEGWSILPFFPGYTFECGKSIYMDEEIGEGGKVYSEPGMYGNVWDGDVTGQHPSSIIAEVLFGPRYTKAFEEIVDGRVSIKHKAWGDIDELFGGKLKPYIQKVIDGELTAKDLANALKTVVNSVYGLTSAKFENPFRDPRNVDNIVAKRGALFMTLLKSEVQKRGFKVCHIKTDSIKIPDATEEIKDFVIAFGKEYGYSFETEAEFDRFCLVNKATYIAKTKDGEWTATGEQFAVPYVFKTLFSKEPIEFKDMCETFSVQSALYLDMNEPLGEDEHDYRFVGRVGSFCPILPGKGGGVLVRESVDKDGNVKYDSANGAKGYRWLESETLQALGKDAPIDRSYYDDLVTNAVHDISEYGDFEWFVSDEPYVGPKIVDGHPDYNEIPFEIAGYMNSPTYEPDDIPFK